MLVVVVTDGDSDGVVGEGAATVLVGAVVVIVVGPVEPPSPLQPATLKQLAVRRFGVIPRHVVSGFDTFH